MTGKKEFLAALEKGLSTLAASDREKSLEYYTEMIEDRMESGQPEEEAVAAMGDLNDIIAQILAETPKKERAKKEKRSLSALEIVLLILGAPIWASLLLAAAIVVFAVYIVIWSVVAALYAVVFSIGAAALGGIWVAVLSAYASNFVTMLYYIGFTLFFAGFAVLLFFACNKAAGLVVKLSAAIAKGIARIFKGKAEEK
ncbi:MAG: DUF1700 domain-containing protein [Clostridia bacterium]|nr:DUF1700 domain-containing protein [Clostridia bacterium]